MAFNFPSSFNLAPGVADQLSTQYAPDDPSMLPPTPEEMARYGATPGDIQVAQNANAPAAPGQSVAAPSRDVAWTPAVDTQRTQAAAQEAALAGAPPVAPKAEPDNDAAPMMEASARYVPGGWQDTSRGVTTHGGINPAAFEDSNRLYDNAASSRMDAAGHAEKAAAGQAKIDAAYFAAAREANDAEAQRQAKIQSERDAYVAAEHTKLEGLSAAAQQQVDPEAAKGSSGAQLMATIGIALGQFGASINGGTNTALQMVNANIDRNIAAQQANIANAGKSYDRGQSLYRQNLEAFGDRSRASAATKMQMLDQAKTIADQQFAAGPKTEEAKARHADLVAGIGEHRGDQAKVFAKDTADTSVTTGQQHYKQGGMVGGGAAVGDKGKEELFVQELGVYARTKDEAVELRKTAHRTQNTVRELNNAKDIIEESKATNDPRKLAILQRKLDGVASRAAVTATVKAGQGAMSAGDREVSEAGLGLKGIKLGLIDKIDITSPSRDSHIDVINSSLAAHQQEFGRMGSGQQRGREVYVKDPVTGKVESRRVLSGSNAATRNKVDNTADLIKGPVGQSSRKK